MSPSLLLAHLLIINDNLQTLRQLSSKRVNSVIINVTDYSRQPRRDILPRTRISGRQTVISFINLLSHLGNFFFHRHARTSTAMHFNGLRRVEGVRSFQHVLSVRRVNNKVVLTMRRNLPLAGRTVRKVIRRHSLS